MKKTILLALSILFLISCKQSTEKSTYQNEELNVITSVYPETMAKVFDAHGGIDGWNEMQSLVFEMEKEGQNEKTTTDLRSRKSLIDAETFMIGFDGTDVWLQEKDTVTYKGNPKFYYNLMFYFYAMPFIVGDDGINYAKTDALEFEGKQYPGIKISYEAGVGESPEDEYVLYYDPETYKMTWLGYTVTYFSKEKSKEFHFIKYADWQTVNGLQLPKTLQWYKYENNLPTTKRNDRHFVNVSLSKDKPKDSIFEKTDTAKVIE
jgi:hypothetical protein